MTEEKPKTKKVNDLDALSTLTGSTNYAIPILDLNDRDADGDPKLKQVPINLLQALFKNETALAKVATSGKYSDLKNLPQLFSGNYDDLSGKPNIPSRTSDLQNDSGFLTEHQNLSSLVENLHYLGATQSISSLPYTRVNDETFFVYPTFEFGNQVAVADDSGVADFTPNGPDYLRWKLTNFGNNGFVVYYRFSSRADNNSVLDERLLAGDYLSTSAYPFSFRVNKDFGGQNPGCFDSDNFRWTNLTPGGIYDLRFFIFFKEKISFKAYLSML